MIHLVMMMKQVDCCGAPNRVRGGGRDGPGGERSFKSFNVWASLASPLSSAVSVQLKTVKLATLTSGLVLFRKEDLPPFQLSPRQDEDMAANNR